MTDENGNILKLPDSTSAKDFPVSVILNKEPLSFVGMESIGWFDISSCNDTLTEVQYSQIEGTMGVSTKDNLAIIQSAPSDLGDSNEDFSIICERFLRKFTTYNNGELIPESENTYKNIETAELGLAGAPAYKVSFETEDLWGRCEMLCGASYVTTNPSGEYIRINIYAPKEGHLDKDGNPFRPGIEDLISIIETTYTRTEP